MRVVERKPKKVQAVQKVVMKIKVEAKVEESKNILIKI